MVIRISKKWKQKVTEAEKQQVDSACQAFIEEKKPQWVPPPNERWGYVSDIYGKWFRNYYYLCAAYRYNDPKAIVPEREVKFVRLEYAGPNRFHVAYFRHTGQWWQVFENLTLQQCLEQVAQNEIFWP